MISDAIIHSPGNRVRTQHKNNRRRKVKEKSTRSLITLERETPLKARQTRRREKKRKAKEVVSFTFTQDFNHEFVIVPRNFILYGLYSRLSSDGELEEIEISFGKKNSSFTESLHNLFHDFLNSSLASTALMLYWPRLKSFLPFYYHRLPG